jgi:autoinducer 2 (AI-2) kinase
MPNATEANVDGGGEYLMSIDVGTGSARAVLFALDGRQVSFAKREYTHLAESAIPGSLVFDCTANWDLICECTHEVLAAAGISARQVLAVSATSMREGMVLYDKSGREIWACPNVDARSSKEADALVSSGAAREIFALAGDWVSITAPARFAWIARHRPELFDSIRHVGMIGDWVLTRLSGVFVTDATLGSSSGMFDLGERTWSARIMEICGLDASLFPPVLEAGTVVGAITHEAAAQTGLCAGTPVVVGGADTQMGLLGIGAQAGDFTIIGGSFWQHTLLVDGPLIDPRSRLRTLCHAVPDQWMVEGIGFYCGIVMRWFRDSFCEAEKLVAARQGVDVYRLLEERAELIPPGSNGVFGLFSNVMQATRWSHTTPSFVGFDVTAPKPEARFECFRAIEEGAAYVSRAHLEILEEVGRRPLRRAVLTGGAANGSLWPQIVADVLDLQVDVPVVKESTALGAAICAGVGAGVQDGIGGARAGMVATERTFYPDAERVGAYSDLYQRWREIYRLSLSLAGEGLARPLWRAAGAEDEME